MSKLMPGESDAAKEAAAAREIPLGRMGRKRDIAMGVLFLASPAAGVSSRALIPCCHGHMGCKRDTTMGVLFLASSPTGGPSRIYTLVVDGGT